MARLELAASEPAPAGILTNEEFEPKPKNAILGAWSQPFLRRPLRDRFSIDVEDGEYMVTASRSRPTTTTRCPHGHGLNRPDAARCQLTPDG
jgi:hypothetical protein